MGTILKVCLINGCNKKIHLRGLCGMHYMRLKRHGSIDIIKQESHGYYKHQLYQVWQNMKNRCYNKDDIRYKDWGGRGITVYEDWMNPKVFIEWGVNNGWEPGLQIDRRNNDGNYNPENCRFITQKENNHNKRLLRSTNTSGYRGVSIHKNKWRSCIHINNKRKHLGLFDSPILAAIAYDNAIPDNRPKNFN